MKRFDDFLGFDISRHLYIKNEYMSRLFTESGLSKGYSWKSKMLVQHFIECLVGNLVEAFILQRNLALRLSDFNLTSNVKNKILKAMVRLGMIGEVRKGYSYEKSSLSIPKGDLTKVEPLELVLNVFDPSRVAISKSWSVVIRKENREVLEKRSIDDHALLYSCANKFQKRVNVPIRSFKRIFSNSPELGGRIYSNYQQMSKEMRKLITIDNEKTTELDFRYNQIRMLFALSGIKDEGDPYLGFIEERSVVKKAMNTLINASNPKRVFCDMRWNAPFRWSSSKADRFISEAFARYPILKDMKGSGIGLKLQKIEGDISLAVMRHALYNNSVVLPIHDSFLVRESEVEKFRHVMEQEWTRVVSEFKQTF